MSQDHNKRYLKRKAKLAQRPAAQVAGVIKPYGGPKYQQEAWTPFMATTELAIYETIRLTDHTLTNATVNSALTKLAQRLNGGLPPVLAPDQTCPELNSGKETEFLIWNIQRRWTRFFGEESMVATKDLVGILRTLLNSIKAHEWHSGREQGYVVFLTGFIERSGLADEAEVEELRASVARTMSPTSTTGFLAPP